MNNSKTRRHRQRRNKLSRRMKKRGGVKRSSSIVNKSLIESIEHPTFKTSGRNTKFDAYDPITGRPTRYVVNTKRDKVEQFKAYDIFNDKFQSIQDSFIAKLNSGMIHQEGHNGQWICVTAGKGKWYPNDGSWEMLPTIVEWSDGAVKKDDDYVMSEAGKNEIFNKNHKSNRTFCVPQFYETIQLIPQNARVSAPVLSIYE